MRMQSIRYTESALMLVAHLPSVEAGPSVIDDGRQALRYVLVPYRTASCVMQRCVSGRILRVHQARKRAI